MTSKQRDGVAEWPFDTGFITAPQNDRLIPRSRQIHFFKPFTLKLPYQITQKPRFWRSFLPVTFYSITSGMKYTKPPFHQISVFCEINF